MVIKISLLTTTGDRPLQLDRARYYIERSNLHNIEYEWNVIDNGATPYNPGGCNYFRRAPNPIGSWQNVADQVVYGIDKCKNDLVIIFEDDDYYHPERIQKQAGFLQCYDMHGFNNTTYYHVGYKMYRYMGNVWNSSFFETGFRRQFLEKLIPLIKQKAQLFDVAIWRIHGKERAMISQNEGLGLGMKGLPGRKGIANHNPKGNYISDKNYEWLRKKLGKEAEWYIDLKLPTPIEEITKFHIIE